MMKKLLIILLFITISSYSQEFYLEYKQMESELIKSGFKEPYLGSRGYPKKLKKILISKDGSEMNLDWGTGYEYLNRGILFRVKSNSSSLKDLIFKTDLDVQFRVTFEPNNPVFLVLSYYWGGENEIEKKYYIQDFYKILSDEEIEKKKEKDRLEKERRRLEYERRERKRLEKLEIEIAKKKNELKLQIEEIKQNYISRINKTKSLKAEIDILIYKNINEEVQQEILAPEVKRVINETEQSSIKFNSLINELFKQHNLVSLSEFYSESNNTLISNLVSDYTKTTDISDSIVKELKIISNRLEIFCSEETILSSIEKKLEMVENIKVSYKDHLKYISLFNLDKPRISDEEIIFNDSDGIEETIIETTESDREVESPSIEKVKYSGEFNEIDEIIWSYLQLNKELFDSYIVLDEEGFDFNSYKIRKNQRNIILALEPEKNLLDILNSNEQAIKDLFYLNSYNRSYWYFIEKNDKKELRPYYRVEKIFSKSNSLNELDKLSVGVWQVINKLKNTNKLEMDHNNLLFLSALCVNQSTIQDYKKYIVKSFKNGFKYSPLGFDETNVLKNPNFSNGGYIRDNIDYSKYFKEKINLIKKDIWSSVINNSTEECNFAEIPKRFLAVEEPPIFNGCENSIDKRDCFYEQMRNHFKKHFIIPEIPEEMASGRFNPVMSFLIERDGTICNIRVRRGADFLKTEILRVLNILPVMTPARQVGLPVTVEFGMSLPILYN